MDETKGKPVNFDENVVQKTQDLKPVVMGNGAFFIFTKKTFKENNNRTGKNPYFYPLNTIEGIEIDASDLEELLEELEFDYDPKPSGWAAALNKPTAEKIENAELLASIEEFKAKNKDLEDENKNLQETVKVTESVLNDYKKRAVKKLDKDKMKFDYDKEESEFEEEL